MGDAGAYLELTLGEDEHALDADGHGVLELRAAVVFGLGLQELGAGEEHPDEAHDEVLVVRLHLQAQQILVLGLYVEPSQHDREPSRRA
jgi:hypothetical protein